MKRLTAILLILCTCITAAACGAKVEEKLPDVAEGLSSETETEKRKETVTEMEAETEDVLESETETEKLTEELTETEKTAETEKLTEKETEKETEAEADGFDDGLYLFQSIGIYGPGLGDTLFNEKNKESIRSESEILNKKFPVIIHKLPVGHGGPLYEITDEVKEAALGNMTRILGLLYEDYDTNKGSHVPYYPITETPEQEGYAFEKEGVRIFAYADNVNIGLDGYDFNEDTAIEDLLDNFAVKAALEYMGMKELDIKYTPMFRTNGDIYVHNYYLTSKTDSQYDRKIFSSFKFVKVIVSPEINHITVRINNEDITNTIDGVEYEDYNAIMEKIYRRYPEIAPEDFLVSVIYYHHYNEDTKTAYYVPGYCVYFPGNGNLSAPDRQHYNYIDVAAINMDDIA